MKKSMLVVICMLFVFMASVTVNAEELTNVFVQTGTDEGINIRVSPSLDSGVYDVVSPGTEIQAYDEYQNGFRKIYYDDQELWAYSSYLINDFTEIKMEYDSTEYTFDSGYQIGLNNCPNDFTGVIVDKSCQKMKLIVDGGEIFTSDVVTGLRYSRDTPTGEFEIWFKTKDFTFTKYDAFSYYFMPLRWKDGYETDYGFHDATWRYEFGGDIYEWDGSHGCINMPLEEASILYEYAYEGMPVYIIE